MAERRIRRPGEQIFDGEVDVYVEGEWEAHVEMACQDGMSRWHVEMACGGYHVKDIMLRSHGGGHVEMAC